MQPSSESTSVVHCETNCTGPCEEAEDQVLLYLLRYTKVYDDEKSKGEQRSSCKGPCCSQSNFAKKSVLNKNRWCISSCSLRVELIIGQAVQE